MSWQSCGGRWWLAASRSVHAGAWGSSCTPSGFATILRPASGSWPNAGCVETSPAGWATLRSTSANPIQRSSTTGLPVPPGPGPGGAGAGTDLETAPTARTPPGSAVRRRFFEGCPTSRAVRRLGPRSAVPGSGGRRHHAGSRPIGPGVAGAPGEESHTKGRGSFPWASWTRSISGDAEVACSGGVRAPGVRDRARHGQSRVRGRSRRRAEAPPSRDRHPNGLSRMGLAR